MFRQRGLDSVVTSHVVVCGCASLGGLDRLYVLRMWRTRWALQKVLEDLMRFPASRLLCANARAVLQMDLTHAAAVLASTAWDAVLPEAGWVYQTSGRRALHTLEKLLRWYGLLVLALAALYWCP